MDLTLDTPPLTPPQPGSPTTNTEEDTRTLSGPKSVYKSRPLSLHVSRPAGFTWHYDTSNYVPPDPPDLVLGATTNHQRSKTLPMPSSPTGAHLVVRADEEPSGIINKLRGAFTKLSTACFPLHVCRGNQPLHTLHHTPPLNPPELRPPHVLAQASKPTKTSQPKKNNSVTAKGSQQSLTGNHSTGSRKNSDENLSHSDTPPNNIHSSLRSLYGYYGISAKEVYNCNDDADQEDSVDAQPSYMYNSNENIKYDTSSNYYGEYENDNSSPTLNSSKTNKSNDNLNISKKSLNSNQVDIPSRPITTQTISSVTSRTVPSQPPPRPARGNSKLTYGTTTETTGTNLLKREPTLDNQRGSNGIHENNNMTAINVQNNLKAHFRIHERPKGEEVTFRIKKDIGEDKSNQNKPSGKTSTEEVETSQQKKTKIPTPVEEKAPSVRVTLVQRKESEEEDLPQVDLSTSEVRF